MTTTKSVKFAFPQGHTSFSVYGATLDIGPYEVAFIHKLENKGKIIRVTLFKSFEEARERHGDDVRKLYVTTPPSKVTQRQYRTLTGPTREILGWEREKNFKFRGVEVPAIIIKQTPTSITFDIDLTGKNIRDLLKMGHRGNGSKKVVTDKPEETSILHAPAAAKTVTVDKAVGNTSKSANQAKAVEPKSVALQQVKPAVQSFSKLSLPGDLTLNDLKRMGFKVMATDANDNPFLIES